MPMRILLVDDHILFRKGIANLLEVRAKLLDALTKPLFTVHSCIS